MSHLSRPRTAGKPRILRTWIEITDQKGRMKSYTVKPVQLRGFRSVYRLVPYDTILGLAAQKTHPPQDPYYCTEDVLGQVQCNCPGFEAWRKCKHLQSLQKLGLLPTPPIALAVFCPTGATL